VLAGEDVAGAAHVGGKLVDFIETAVDDLAAEGGVAEVSDYEIVGRRVGKLRELQIDAPHPEPIRLQAPDEVAPDKASRATDQYYSCGHASHDVFSPTKQSSYEGQVTVNQQ
jgi:hypothetical protein